MSHECANVKYITTEEEILPSQPLRIPCLWFAYSHSDRMKTIRFF